MDEGKAPARIEFKLTEEQILDTLEAIADSYGPSDALQKFVTKLEEARDWFAEERIRQLDFDLMRHLEDEGEAA
jgi:hypothetical protein